MMPEWVKSVLESIENPQQFLQKIVSRLDGQGSDLLFSLPPPKQLMLTRAVMLNPQHWNNIGKGLYESLCLLEAEAATNDEGVQIASSEPKTVKLVVFHCCSGIGTSVVVLKTALLMFNKKGSSVTFEIVEQHSFENNEDCIKVQTQLFANMGQEVTVHNNVNALPGVIRDSKEKWTGCKLLFMNSPPCKNTSVANPYRDRPDGSGFHMSHSRAVWPIIEGQFHTCRPEFDGNNVFHMTEFPQCGNKGEEAVMDLHFGDALEITTTWYRAATRTRRMRTNPKNLDLKYNSMPMNPFATLDGWRWCGNMGTENPNEEILQWPEVVLRSHIVKLVQNAVFDPSAVTASEWKTLKTIKMQHPNETQQHYINRQFWFLWMGMRGTPLQTVMDDLYPCIPWIISSLGVKAANQSHGEPCGLSRYCVNCEKVFEMLGQAWHLPIMVDVCYGLLVKIEGIELNTVPNQDIFNPQVTEAHQCGPACPNNPHPDV